MADNFVSRFPGSAVSDCHWRYKQSTVLETGIAKIPFDVHAEHDEDVPLRPCIGHVRLAPVPPRRIAPPQYTGSWRYYVCKNAWNPRPPLDRQSARTLTAVDMYVSFSLMSRCMRILATARSKGMKTSVLDDIDSKWYDATINAASVRNEKVVCDLAPPT